MLRNICYAAAYAAAAAMFASAVYGLPVEQWNQVSSQDLSPQFHAVDLENMNLTALAALSPSLPGLDKRHDGGLALPSVTGQINVCKDEACQGLCSAALVGPRHLLTARHCALPLKGSLGVFYPHFDHGTHAPEAEIEHAYIIDIAHGRCRTKADFAVMVLSERIGDAAGWFGVTLPNADLFNQPIFSTRGYSAALDNFQKPQTERGITIPSPFKDLEDGRSQFDCDATGPIYSDNHAYHGQSGSPIYDDSGKIWGVLSSSLMVNFPLSWGSSWASGDAMLAAVNQALKEYP